MKKIIMALGFLGILGAISVGCGGNDCEKAADEITAKYEECGKDVPTASGDSSGECDEAAGKKALCLSGCFKAASCDCAGLGDATKCEADALKTYTDCVGGC